MLRIEAVMVSVDHGDYLSHTLPRLLPHVERLVVYTSETDCETLGVCLQWDVECVRSMIHCHNGAKLAKASAINAALLRCRGDGWLLVQDADIVVPPDLGRRLRNAILDQSCLYGVDRVDCPGFRQWCTYRDDPTLRPQDGSLIAPPVSWSVSPRLSHLEYGGWCPLGFWQLWHGSVTNRYTVSPGADCEHSDLLHASRWPRGKRVLLPDWYAVHLLSGPRAMGADWHGRTTERFGANPWTQTTAAVRSGSRPPGATPPADGGAKSTPSNP